MTREPLTISGIRERYVLFLRPYGVIAYRREDGARMGGYLTIEYAVRDLKWRRLPRKVMPPLHPDFRNEIGVLNDAMVEQILQSIEDPDSYDLEAYGIVSDKQKKWAKA